jgi:hypothetical protein
MKVVSRILNRHCNTVRASVSDKARSNDWSYMPCCNGQWAIRRVVLGICYDPIVWEVRR